jgi:hypothetical protein
MHMSRRYKYNVTARKIQLFRREENPNFNLISWNFEETIAITIAIFEYKEVYNVPYIGLQ